VGKKQLSTKVSHQFQINKNLNTHLPQPTMTTAPAYTVASEGENGRISHRAAGGPDLNYLYATDHFDSTPSTDASSKPFQNVSDDTVKAKSKKTKNNGSNKENSNQNNSNPSQAPMVTVIDPTTKKPIQRGRRSDKRSIRGQTLYLGGEEAPNNKIYCIPGHSERVLCIDTETDDVYPIGPILEGKFKWLRGIVIGEIIYGLPCHADCILRIDTKDDTVTTIPIPYEENFENDVDSNNGVLRSKADLERYREWKYHGGAISPHDGCIYAVPQSALRVLRIDPVAETCSFVGPEFEGRCKWYGGVVGKTDGAIYCIPQNAEGVLRIDASGVKHAPQNSEARPESLVIVTTHGSFPLGGHKWHGASASADGTIVSVPANADNVLCIVPSLKSAYTVSSGQSTSLPSTTTIPEPTLYILEGETPGDIATGRHRTDNKYKYLGAMKGPDGNVYCFPSGSERVLQIDTVKRVARSVGPNLRDNNMESLFQNKWQNGLTTDEEGCVYAIPLAAETVLRIKTGNPGDNEKKDATADVEVTTWKLPQPNKTLAKWEGGVIAKNGIMYCMPNNHKAVLQIVPPCVPSRDGLAEEMARREKELKKAGELQRQKELEQRRMEKEEKEKKKREKKELKQMEKYNKDGPSGNVEVDRKQEKDEETTPGGIPFKYKTGIATLRSSAHRVKYSLNHRKHDPNPVGNDGSSTNTSFLPADLCLENIMKYNIDEYDFHGAIVNLLRGCDEDLIGTFRLMSEDIQATSAQNQFGNIALERVASKPGRFKLENFEVPVKSLTRKCQNGSIEKAQKYLSDKVHSDTNFLTLFDKFVENAILPLLKQRMQHAGVEAAYSPITFYYQRPPTLRIQPGPARALVRAHDDAEYGHQNGELNFWLPLTNRDISGVDLWCESSAGSGDFHPVKVSYGEVVSFHGSSCRHYVNPNHSQHTRVSLDFRVGVEGFFDPCWQMVGTTDDHSRRKVTL